MTTNITEGGQPEGAPGQPNQNVSPPDVQQPSPDGAVTIETVLQRVADLEGQLRGVQSTKDRGTAKLNKKVDSLAEQITRYEALRARGVEPDVALREMEIDDLLAERRGTQQPEQVPQQVQAGSPAPAANIDTQGILKTLGLDPASPEVTEILRTNTDAVSQIAAAVELVKRRRAQAQAAPNPATVVPTGQGAPAGGDLEAEYKQKLSQIRRGDVASVTALQQEYVKKGLQI